MNMNPDIRLRCSRILVTGGGSGIGRAIAERLAAAGAQVTIAGRHMEKLRSAAAEIGSDRIHPIVWDIADVDAWQQKAVQIQEMMGGLDGFVNAAALGSAVVTGRGFDPFDITASEWDQLNDVNFKAAFFMLRNEATYLKSGGIAGNILNIASNAAYMDISGSYGAAKLAVVRWTRTFAKRFGHDGIVINGIAPGATFTPMIARYAHDPDQPYPRHAIGRLIRPEEIAELAHYMMSNYGEILCGHTVVADGGDTLAGC